MPDTIRGTAPRNGLPERKNYVYRGSGASEPPEVAAARLRHKAIDAEIERRSQSLAAAAADTAGPDAAAADPAPAVPAQRAPARPPVSLADWEWCGGCGYLTSCCRCADPEPAPVPAAEPARCRRCGYLTTSGGHRVMCHG